MGFSARPGGLEPPTVSLEERVEPEQLPMVSSGSGLYGGQIAEVARALLEDIGAGRAVQRRDAVRLARSILESAVVRLAGAVLEADDRQLLPRLVDLLDAVHQPMASVIKTRFR
jgi:hypothetical protein